MLRTIPIVHKVVHSKAHEHICKVAHNAEHPCMVLYPLMEILDWHGAILYVCYALVGTGVFAIVYERVFGHALHEEKSDD